MLSSAEYYVWHDVEIAPHVRKLVWASADTSPDELYRRATANAKQALGPHYCPPGPGGPLR
jgi:hypothetical protein